MLHILITALRLFFTFIKTGFGCLNKPYITFRELAYYAKDIRPTVFIWFLVIVYFAFASMLRAGVANPYLLTMQFNKLLLGSLIGSAGMVCLLYLLGTKLGGKGKLSVVYHLWSYTLLPTIVWFFLTSLFYLVLPPPRTLSIWGKLFSVVFITVSLALLLWKVILYYLTLRFALKLDLFKIGQISAVIVPVIIVYAVISYHAGIFRIPFI